MIEFEVLIPVASNAGVEFSAEHDSVFEAALLSHFGGFSRKAGLVQGSWVGADGTHFTDATRVYVIALSSVLEAGKLRDVIDFAKAHYEQEAIYLRYLGLSEIL